MSCPEDLVAHMRRVLAAGLPAHRAAEVTGQTDAETLAGGGTDATPTTPVTAG